MTKKDKFWIKLMDMGHLMGCHQMPERSFFLRGYQLPVCARCTGVIIGEIIEIFLIYLKTNINLTIAILMLCIMGLDWGVQYLKIRQSTNLRRLITGISGGIGLTYIYYRLIALIIENLKILF